ncbi:M28 family peptidase [Adhaeribacter aquaticus]|uniref:M28 family peptidase n=1 Tax=Adhaeribacter aquaticus TaxID=299567 RepID=UPI00041E38BE|nr:M28 family peptidase [Adhaeribacter aquaticus]
MMKRIFWWAGLLLLGGVLSAYLLKNSSFNKVKMNKPIIEVKKERLYADVKFLTELNPPRQFQHITSLNKSAEYIYQEFEKVSTRVSFQTFTIDGQEYKNVICSMGPETGERLILGAHYDVCGDQPGADDNASGVAGLLEIARLVQEQKIELKYRLDFVAFALEEPPFFKTDGMGSAVHAKSLAKEKVPVKAMICLEMIGYYSEKKNSQDFPVAAMKAIYPTTANFIAVVGNMGQTSLVSHVKKQMLAGSSIDVQSLTAPASVPGVDFSDHLNYWRFNYPAVMITNTSFFRNENYHMPTDTIDTLDFDKMAEVVKGVFWALIQF